MDRLAAANTRANWSWACHATRKRLNLCDGSKISTATLLTDPQKMDFETFVEFLCTKFVDGPSELAGILRYAVQNGVDPLNGGQPIRLYTMHVKHHLRTYNTSTFHEEQWYVAVIDNRVFAVGQPSDILD
jgi:hypothetical protein